jgi:hypothetical protein
MTKQMTKQMNNGIAMLLDNKNNGKVRTAARP